MQLKLPFRLTRGATVILIIVSAHLIIAALFIRMRVKVPEMGPVFATIFLEPPDSPMETPDRQPPPAPEPDPAPVEVKPAPETPPETPPGTPPEIPGETPTPVASE